MMNLVLSVTDHFQLFSPIRNMNQETSLKGQINLTFAAWEFHL